MNKRRIGQTYETIAVDYLLQKGYHILERNYQGKSGEIDILAMKQGVLVAVEVKYRKDNKYGTPSEAVDVWKQRKISRVFLEYCAYHGYDMDTPSRFDVIGIWGDGTIEHILDAFEFIN